MANRIKISILAPPPCTVDTSISKPAMVDAVTAHWQRQLDQVLPDQPDLILLPEACDRPPNLSLPERLAYYRVRGNQIRDFFAATAAQDQCHIAYSAAREMADGTWRNSTQLLGPQGTVLGCYNKNHVVIEETTEAGILCGRDAPIIACSFGRVACVICFDLNFDELRQTYAALQPDLILFSSMYHGSFMQSCWAYFCRAHFAAAVPGLPSAILSPLGEELASTTNYFPYVTAEVNLDCCTAHLDYNRHGLARLKAAHGPEVTIHDPGLLGSVLITSESSTHTARELAAAYDIELLDDYMARALAHHHDPCNREP